MPYVDQGEPKAGPSLNLSTFLPYIAGAVGAVIAFFIWGVLYTQMQQNQWIAPILGGPIIGGAMRLAGKRPVPFGGLVAIGLVVVSGLAGYLHRHVVHIIWVDPNFKPDVNHAINWMFKDITGIFLMGFSAYLAYIIVRSYPPNLTQAPSPHE